MFDIDEAIAGTPEGPARDVLVAIKDLGYEDFDPQAEFGRIFGEGEIGPLLHVLVEAFGISGAATFMTGLVVGAQIERGVINVEPETESSQG